MTFPLIFLASFGTQSNAIHVCYTFCRFWKICKFWSSSFLLNSLLNKNFFFQNYFCWYILLKCPTTPNWFHKSISHCSLQIYKNFPRCIAASVTLCLCFNFLATCFSTISKSFVEAGLRPAFLAASLTSCFLPSWSFCFPTGKVFWNQFLLAHNVLYFQLFCLN